jgi:hypothetical protein
MINKVHTSFWVVAGGTRYASSDLFGDYSGAGHSLRRFGGDFRTSVRPIANGNPSHDLGY